MTRRYTKLIAINVRQIFVLAIPHLTIFTFISPCVNNHIESGNQSVSQGSPAILMRWYCTISRIYGTELYSSAIHWTTSRRLFQTRRVPTVNEPATHRMITTKNCDRHTSGWSITKSHQTCPPTTTHRLSPMQILRHQQPQRRSMELIPGV